MKLHGQQIVVFNHGGEREAVIAHGGGVRLTNSRGVGMRKIKIGVVGDPFQQNGRTKWANLVPADVRRLHVFRQRLHLPVNEIEA